jgi:hypothetical protein
MKKYLVLSTALMLTLSSLYPDDVSGRQFISSQVDEQCTEVLISYFPKTIVTEVLTQNKIDTDKIPLIANALVKKSNDVIKVVQKKAGEMDPNPLKDPSMHEQTGKLIREAVLEIFSSVLKANGVRDEQQIQILSVAIQQKKAALFAECMEKAQPKNDVKGEDDSDNEKT